MIVKKRLWEQLVAEILAIVSGPGGVLEGSGASVPFPGYFKKAIVEPGKFSIERLIIEFELSFKCSCLTHGVPEIEVKEKIAAVIKNLPSRIKGRTGIKIRETIADTAFRQDIEVAVGYRFAEFEKKFKRSQAEARQAMAPETD
ncbi:MAG: hypothetical protein PHE24_04070 [Patescibacteria group bacterium]|nr:hypothetical protein [Patescibacteria group bacterium]